MKIQTDVCNQVQKNMLKELKKVVLLKSQKGATAVEFAIILPLLLLLIFGIIEFGLFLYNRHVITNAVREAARAGIVVRIPRLSNDDIETTARNYCEQHLVTFGAGTLNIFLLRLRENVDADGNRTGEFSPLGQDELGGFPDVLIVRATYIYDWLFLSTIGMGPMTLEALARMRME